MYKLVFRIASLLLVVLFLQQCSCIYSQTTSISTKTLSGDVLLGPRYNLNYSTFTIVGLNVDGYSNSNHRSNIARPPGKIAIFGVDVVIRNETAGLVDGVLPVADPDIVRLNHLIFRNTGNMDLMCGGKERFAGFGESLTAISLPLPYAYFVSSDDEFEVYFAIESNVFQEDLSLTIEYSFEWASLYKSEENEDVIQDNPFSTVISATPLYIDITGCDQDPFYKLAGTNEVESKEYTFQSEYDGDIVMALGHLETTGISISIYSSRSNSSSSSSPSSSKSNSKLAKNANSEDANSDPLAENLICSSLPTYNDDPTAPRIVDMSSCYPAYPVRRGDWLRLQADYQSPDAIQVASAMILYQSLNYDQNHGGDGGDGGDGKGNGGSRGKSGAYWSYFVVAGLVVVAAVALVVGGVSLALIRARSLTRPPERFVPIATIIVPPSGTGKAGGKTGEQEQERAVSPFVLEEGGKKKYGRNSRSGSANRGSSMASKKIEEELSLLDDTLSSDELTDTEDEAPSDFNF